MQDTEKKPRKPGSGGKREGAGRTTVRPTISISITLFVDQVEHLDKVAGEGYRSQVARMMLDLAFAAEKQKPK